MIKNSEIIYFNLNEIKKNIKKKTYISTVKLTVKY